MVNKSIVILKSSCYNIHIIRKGSLDMKTLKNGVEKLFVTYFMVIVVFIMLPVFLVTDQVPLFNSAMDYLFSNKTSL